VSYHDEERAFAVFLGFVLLVMGIGVALGWFIRGEPSHNQTCADLRCVGDGGWQRVCVERP